MVLLFVTVTAFTAAAGCTQANPNATPCRNIPPNGCPLLADDSECSDPACAAAYACTEGAWTLDHTCPGFDAGRADATTPAPADAGGVDCPDALFDAPPGASGGPGCNELVVPDCPLSRALFCDPAGADPCADCDSFWACEEGAWIFWGSCLPDGGVSLKN
jgi:hypothetical protein